MGAVPIQPLPEPSAPSLGIWTDYTKEPWPLGGYAALIAAYVGGTSALLISAAKANKLPQEINVKDILLLGIATHKLTRIITKDWVTSPLRAPFTRYVRSLGAGEQSDESRGSGVRKAIGDLITCPWCSGPWVATTLIGGMLFRPRLTRAIAGMLASVTVSDYLHHVWDFTRAVSKKRVEEG
ncbi:MAG: hypothetical protein DMG64_14735 [Acidobacteria bacterium]|nr:MAG: hypothetical protein DMG63_17180 [Acidobacteriota bacterium]PYY01305.1 MAG: hypothetical protein DMG64_14735 [Acidobacteriota bacterium]PYY20886.1 MAG: hypothetical protein DMG62_21430 [Acidobacteriota bacterium]